MVRTKFWRADFFSSWMAPMPTLLAPLPRREASAFSLNSCFLSQIISLKYTSYGGGNDFELSKGDLAMSVYLQKVGIFAFVGLLAATMVSTSAAQDVVETEDEGRVIRVGPDRPERDPLPGQLAPRRQLRDQFQPWLLPGNPADIARQRQPASPFYIGVAAEQVDDLVRAHVDLDDGVGLAVRMVFEGSPADEAGLKQHDILVAADGEDLRELADLVAAVQENSGEQMTQFTLDVIRNGQPQTIWVTPAERPQPDELSQPDLGGVAPPFGGEMNFGGLRPRLLQLPGFNLDQLPGNVSVQIERDGDGAAKVRVDRDGETWEVKGDDPESLEQLPEDLRPMVEGMLNGGQGAAAWSFDSVLPGQATPPELQQRLEEMETRMRELQRQLQDDGRNVEEN